MLPPATIFAFNISEHKRTRNSICMHKDEKAESDFDLYGSEIKILIMLILINYNHDLLILLSIIMIQ